MKKYLLLTALFLTTTAQADFWSNCTTYGGTIITANKYGTDANGNNLDKGGLCNDPNDPNLTNNCNGKKFCVSGNRLNWWSAFTWCESIGGQLASFEHMCPGTQALNGNACPNLTAVYNITKTYLWNSVKLPNGMILNVSPQTGITRNYFANESYDSKGSVFATCEEK